MKSQADKHHSERDFAVGELVYLKLQPYIQTSIAPRTNQKLSFRFFGPFKILARVGAMAYKFDLLADCRINSVVHVSQLKKHVPPTFVVKIDLTVLPTDPQLSLTPI